MVGKRKTASFKKSFSYSYLKISNMRKLYMVPGM